MDGKDQAWLIPSLLSQDLPLKYVTANTAANIPSRATRSALLLLTPVSFPDYSKLAARPEIVGFDLYRAMREFSASYSNTERSGAFSEFSISLGSYASVWYYPGCLELTYEQLDLNVPSDRFIQRQLAAVLFHLECAIDRCHTAIDPPSAQRRWANKLNQLAFFSTLNFLSLPPTVISADCSRDGSLRILKHLSETRAFGSTHSVYARVLNPDLAVAFSHAPCPFIVQDLLVADFEYRAMFFGSSYMIVSIDRRSLGPDCIDVHCLDNIAEYTSTCSIPSDALDALLRLRSLIDLNVFAIDFFIQNGRLVPLEVNPQFSWAWLPAPALSRLTAIIFAFLDKLHDVHDT